MLSNKLEETLRDALSIANEYKHEYTTFEHLLLALLKNKDAKAFFNSEKTNIKAMEKKLKSYVENNLDKISDAKVKESKPTAGFQRIIQRAVLHSQVSGQNLINGVHVLAEFFFEYDSFALTCLKEAGLTRQQIIDYLKTISDSLNKESLHDARSKEIIQTYLLDNATKQTKTKEKNQKNETSTSFATNSDKSELEKYSTNLNKKAEDDNIDCLIGREEEIQRAVEILSRRKKNNAILVGEPGVGKTAIAEGLAMRINKNQVPDLLKGMHIYALDISSLIAGTKFRGEFEERVKNLLKILKENKNIILFIDEVHLIIGAGATTTGAMDASNLLKPALANGELRCIGSTTFKEYHSHFEKDMALVRRFQKIIVKEPDEENSLKILEGLKTYYEKHHNVKYTKEALKSAISLSKRYINDRHLPDKAIDLMDEAGARSKSEKRTKKTPIITEKNIADILSSILNIPNLTAKGDDITELRHLGSKLKKLIFGQDQAIDNLCSSIKLSRAGLRKGNKPTGCYLFAGPTGVGKTELAKYLAEFCNMKLIKFDMSEYSESNSVAKLIGAAPGYVGYEQGGLITEEVSKYPYSVIVFDEIEKAHQEIYNLLLQIMDEGILSDNAGKSVNFTNSIIILTTNIITKKEKQSIGFSQDTGSIVDIDMEPLNKHFSAEFRSRLDNIILFNPIDEIIDKIVSKNLKELSVQLADKNVKINISSSVKRHLAKNYFINSNGARELDKAIDREIKQIIAEEILFGKLKNGGIANLDLLKNAGKISFNYTSTKSLKNSTEEVYN